MYLVSKFLETFNIYPLIISYIVGKNNLVQDIQTNNIIIPSDSTYLTIYYKYIDEVNYPEFFLIRYPDYGFVVSSIILQDIVSYPVVTIYIIKSDMEKKVKYIVYKSSLYKWDYRDNTLTTNDTIDKSILTHFREPPLIVNDLN